MKNFLIKSIAIACGKSHPHDITSVVKYVGTKKGDWEWLSLVICHWSFVIGHLSFVINHQQNH
ncbi:hypothetical protein [Scytonema sp. NUACC21]